MDWDENLGELWDHHFFNTFIASIHYLYMGINYTPLKLTVIAPEKNGKNPQKERDSFDSEPSI